MSLDKRRVVRNTGCAYACFEGFAVPGEEGQPIWRGDHIGFTGDPTVAQRWLDEGDRSDLYPLYNEDGSLRIKETA